MTERATRTTLGYRADSVGSSPRGQVGRTLSIHEPDRHPGRGESAVPAELRRPDRIAPHPFPGAGPLSVPSSSPLDRTARWMQALLARYRGDHGIAIAAYNLVAHQLGMIECLEQVAALAGSEGDIERAAVLLGAVEAQREALAPLLPDAADGRAYPANGSVPTANRSSATARARGRAMSLHEAVLYALATPDRAPRLAATEESSDQALASLLTAREREVAALIARGFSKRRIAEDLVLSVRTVERHIENIYSKLGVSGRAARAAVTRFLLCSGAISDREPFDRATR